tara:strand:- start:151 stop:1119 length:969 start_codon:yes stop_codon:yes gene_type:complete
MALKDIISPYKSDLDQINQNLDAFLLDETTPEIRAISEHLLAAKGKQLRPLLGVLFFHAFNGKNPEKMHYVMAAIESIHMASLIHDDIIDGSEKRRGQDSVYHRFGQDPAIISGVYVYSSALKLIAKSGDLTVLNKISETVKQLCQGELIQLFNRDDSIYSMSQYENICTHKTGVLFACACYSGTHLATQNEETAMKSYDFGIHLGKLFQLVDDYLDLFGSQKDLKKDPLQDIANGDITLPIIVLYHSLSDSAKDTFHHAKKSIQDFKDYLSEALDSSIKTQCLAVISQSLEQADTAFVSSTRESLLLSKIKSEIVKRCEGL